MTKHTTTHHDGSGKTTWVSTTKYDDGCSKTTVSRGTEDFFGIRSSNIVSETKTDRNGNSWTKRK